MTRPASCQVTLVLSGLSSAAADADRHLPALASLLARADRLAAPPAAFDARLFHLFGIALPPDADLPVAAVTRLADMGVVDREWWIRADPVYLEPGRESLVLHPVTLTPVDATRLVEELSESLVPDGWLLRAPHPQRWYAKPPQAPALVTTPLADSIGLDIRDLLPRGPDGKAWHTRLSELQILLHTAGTNAGREARGERPANSVWFWGGGRLPQPGAAPWTQVWSNEPLVQGLARLCAVPAGPLPANGKEWLAALHGNEGSIPVYAVADGLLTRRSDWFDAVAILHDDPLNPGQKVWIYYGDMGASDGITSFVAEDFPSGGLNVPVKAGQVIGYQGTWNDRPGWATWVHVLLGVVRANGQDFPAEFTPGIVLDPRPYFNLALLPEAESKFRQSIKCGQP